MSHQKHSFCRICEPHCPLVAEFSADGTVSQLSPDRGHPCGGTACHKGLSFLNVHRDPDRLNWPLKRSSGPGESPARFERTDWSSALADVGARIAALQEKHGRDAVAVYLGNPGAFNATGAVMTGQFQELLGSRMRFCASTQDSSNKLSGAAAIYGSSNAFPIPDIENTDYLLCMGANPRVSHWTLVSAPNDIDAVKRIRHRGGKVVFVNPRNTESSTDETGPTLQIRPGTDVYFLAAILNEIDRRHGLEMPLVSRHGKNVDGLVEFVRRYPASRVAAVTGIESQVVSEVASDMLSAKSATVYVATGINQSRQGQLCYWLAEMINLVTGNLGRKGGSLRPVGLFDHFAPEGVQTVKTSLGDFVLPDPIGFVVMPGTVMADLIENGDIRALVVIAGNPLLSIGGEERLRASFEKLELLVVLDIYRSATAELAHYVLPTTDWMEREDILLFPSGMQIKPYVQYTEALERPMGERRSEAWILARLMHAAGLQSPFGAVPDSDVAFDERGLLNSLLAARGLSVEQMQQMPYQTVLLPDVPPESFFDRCLQHPDKKVDCCPPAFVRAGLFQRCHALFEELESERADVLKLISVRTAHMHNSWMANVESLRRGKQAVNPLYMCEEDAAVRGLFDGDVVRVRSRYGEVRTRLQITSELRPGVVALSHGYGHQQAHGLQRASSKPGVNYNRLTPSGVDAFERVSNMAWLSAVPVEVDLIES